MDDQAHAVPERGRCMTNNELDAQRQQEINDTAVATRAYVDEKVAGLRSFLVNDDEDDPGLLVLLLADTDQRIDEIDTKIKQILAGPVGPEGHLPPVKPFKIDTVHYKGDCVSHAGACYQAVSRGSARAALAYARRAREALSKLL